ncbi:MAG TPA: cytochrome c [Gemmatimonadaceae bacterium]
MRLRTLLLSGLIATPTAGIVAGGWAVVTVENPPEHLVAGVPYTIEYSVRQHGKELLTGLKGNVEARAGGEVVRVDARSSGPKYSATLTLPRADSWTITVNSGFGPSKTTLKPIMARASGAAPIQMAEAQRGEHLFYAKGCATCHVEMKVIPVDVRSGKYDAQFVKKLLADPASMPKRHAADVEMPDLGLKSGEIAALAAYLAGTNTAGTR